MSDCIFCLLANDAEIIAESELCLAFYDGFPVNPGHALAIPKRHVASYFDLTKEEVAAMQAMLFEIQPKIQERFQPDGFNIGVNVGGSCRSIDLPRPYALDPSL